MLFNSYEFLLGFFPLVFCAFFIIARYSRPVAATWLGLASLYFYGYWRLAGLPLLLVSICINYWFGLRVTPAEGRSQRQRHGWLCAAVTVDLAILAYFKYADFFIENVNATLHALTARQLAPLHVVLPIGISFFTFTQIAFIVDCYEGKVRERNFNHYLLFVSYFPHLISGPVLHHSQMMPQFRRPETYQLRVDNFIVGLLFVVMGMAKKVLLADEVSQYASPVFDAARDGWHPGFVAAWTGALAYTLQIYFDFSGYSDMAVGLSRMLGIRLPLNFNAPYKSTNIVEFWRRWHMSLSQFLRDYLYVPLGGNRRGAVRRYANLMTTMLLGGLWHGASWTFVAWGGLHGLYLLVNHAWRSVSESFGKPGPVLTWIGRCLAPVVTFLAVVIAWVFFRSSSFAGALRVLQGMLLTAPSSALHETFNDAFRGVVVPPNPHYLIGMLLLGYLIVWLLPTSQDLAERAPEARPGAAWVASGSLLFVVGLLAVINASHRVSEFIYFNF